MVGSVAFSPDGQWVATGSRDSTARVFDAATGRELARLEHRSWVGSVAFSPDGKWVATGSVDKTARVFDTTSDSAPLIVWQKYRLQPVIFTCLSRDPRMDTAIPLYPPVVHHASPVPD